MKKFTLLFATLLAMSGMAFGQKEGKVLWEKKVEEFDTQNKNTFFYPTSVSNAPNGNLLLSSGYSISGSNKKLFYHSYDKDGKTLWVDTDYLKQNTWTGKDSRNQQDYFVMSNSIGLQDSAFFFNKNYQFVKSFDTRPISNAYLLDFEDGVLYSDPQNRLIKYDIGGKQDWVYQNQEKTVILTNKAPYLGLIGNTSDEHSILILDSKGQKKGITAPNTFNSVYQTKDKGFWLQNKSLEYIKFDSTGKETTKSRVKNIFPENSTRGFSSIKILGDNSILFTYITVDNKLTFTKINVTGEALIISKDLGSYVRNNKISGFDININDDDKIVYYVEYSVGTPTDGKRNMIIGSEDIKDAKLSWIKDLSLGKFIIRKEFFLKQRQFLIISQNADYRTSQIYSYGFDGSLKWQNEVDNFSEFIIINDMMYVTTFNNYQLYKIDNSTGKLIWKINNFEIIDLGIHLKVDSNGKEYLLGRVCENSQCISKLKILNTDGTTQSEYIYPALVFNNSSIIIGNDGSVISASIESQLNQTIYTFMLRKIKFCNELLPISITANNTEACPTEKVKLSATKQDGITYQWQKDGKDLPNYKDVVYDMSESGTYTVIAKDEACQNTVTSNALKVTIRSLPSAEITAPKTIFCEGDKITLASQTNGSFFQWQKDGKDIPNATSSVYEVSQSGDYRVGVRDDKCPQVGYSNIATINVKPAPEATISTDIKGVIYEPFKVKLNANVGAGLSYEWYKNDSLITNATTSIYEANKSGTYQVKVSKDGCVKLSEPFKISILIPLANESEVGEEEVQVYPNPSRGEFNVILPKSLKNADIQLFDSFGRERSLLYTGEQAQAVGLTQGVYFLKIGKENKVVTSKIVIE